MLSISNKPGPEAMQSNVQYVRNIQGYAIHYTLLQQ